MQLCGETAVLEWRTLWSDIYSRSAPPGDTPLDLAGWTSSYTGRPIAEREMREWIERTVERILALRPRRLLEIGASRAGERSGRRALSRVSGQPSEMKRPAALEAGRAELWCGNLVGEQGEAVVGGPCQGRREGLEDGMDRRGEVVVVVRHLPARGAGLSGLASVVVSDGVAALRRGQTLAGLLGYTGHGSLLVCDVRVVPYPPLHQGGSPRRNPKNGKSRANTTPLRSTNTSGALFV